MESTSTKANVIKPVLLKAGIPLAITVVGFLFARITTRKCLKTSSAENQVTSADQGSTLLDVQPLNSSSLSASELEAYHPVKDTSNPNSEEELQLDHIVELELEVLVLRNQIKDLHSRGFELESRYFHYRDTEEQELLLLELQNILLLEITRVDQFLDDEELDNSSAEVGERKRYEIMAVDHLKILELLEISRSRNRLLQRKVKKLLRKYKVHSRVIKQQQVQIEAKEAEISGNHQELEAKANIIRRRESDIQELKMAVGQLQMEKDELLLRQIELENSAASSKVKNAEERIMVDYDQVAAKLEQLEKEHTAEIKELIYVRWCNACLRHEQMRKQEDLQQQRKKQMIELISDIGTSDNGHDHSSWDHGTSCLKLATAAAGGGDVPAAQYSRRQKLIDKFKRWVEGRGSDNTKQKTKGKKKHHDNHSLPDHGPEEDYLHSPPAWKSSSSV